MEKPEFKTKPCHKPCQCDIKGILKRLKWGNARYRRQKLKCFCRGVESEDEQRPYAAIISCADSRVIPERIFDVGPGELFVTRVAGNIADDASIASLEFAVANLGTRFLVVLGHEKCGAVKEAIATTREPFDHSYTLGHNLDSLLAQVRPAVVAQGRCASEYDVVKENARLNARQLRIRSEIIRDTPGVAIFYAFYNHNDKVEFHRLK